MLWSYSGAQIAKMSLPIVPWPPNTVSSIFSRSTASRNACLTRTSLNGALSTRIVNGFQPPPGEMTAFLPEPVTVPSTSCDRRLITSTCPPSSALTWLVSSA